MAGLKFYGYDKEWDVTVAPSGGDYTSIVSAFDSLKCGSATTQFDISNTAGSTYRYTYDGTGTDPVINATTFPVGRSVYIAAQNFSAGNNGLFTVTASAADYFEVTNSAGVAESNKTIGTGYLDRVGSIIVKAGAYAETTHVIAPAACRIHFDHGVKATIAVGYAAKFNRDLTTVTGHWYLTGDGDTASSLLYIGGTDTNLDGLDTTVALTRFTDGGAGWAAVVQISGTRVKAGKIYNPAWTASTTTTTRAVYWTANYSTAHIIIAGITQASTFTTYGMHLTSNASFNCISCSIRYIITTGNNAGTGLLIDAGANYNAFYGSSRDCDLANLNDGGTGSAKGALAT